MHRRLQKIYFTSLVMTLVCAFTGCNSIEDYDNDISGNFDALWNFVDGHYCFFEQKGIDWSAVGEKYRQQAKQCATQRALFNVMAAMLDELRDGHVNLSSPFETSYYRKWWSDYPQNYDERLVEQYYLNFDYHSLGSVYYGILPGHNIGYLRIPTFSSGLGEGNIDAILDYFNVCSGLIIDVRDNGGGALTNVETYVSRFIDKPVVAGYMMHKQGPAHNDFSKPYEYSYKPTEGHLLWSKPVVVLTNRSTFSAANNFVGIMKSLPTVTIVGATTGGGSGMPLSSELPCGWGIRISACRVLDPQGNDTEFGVEPTEGWAVDLDPVQALTGKDTILEAAIQALTH
ncbi:MAG: S41 family peptidase [Muribaculaceae bacterium]|nr:S41 family peptidase [Muribaculaceae bacterium]